MVLRARLMEQLIEPGLQHELRSEVYLCGLLSQLDDLLGEPVGTILHRIPLSDRVFDAIVMRTTAPTPLPANGPRPGDR
jgi:c-di-GMP-related signal transduction protein